MAKPSVLRLIYLPAMLALSLSVAACNKTTVSNEAPPEAGDVAVARIDGETIWTSDVRAEAIAQGQIGPGEPLDVTSDLFSRTLEEVIDQRLLAKAAMAKGLEKSTTAQRRLRAAHDRILGDMLVETSIDRDIDDKAVKDHYDEQVKLSKQSEEIRTRLILLRTKAEADAALKQLQGGALFEAMAMEKSIDQGTRFNGGDMGYFTTDIMPQAYKGVLATAKTGDTVGPVQVDGGWALLRVEDRRPEQLPTLEEERPIIMRYLIYNQVAGMLNSLRKKAKVELLVKPSQTGSGQEPDSAPASMEADDASADSASASSAVPVKKAGQKT
ncbi:peptidylprolyl isomerase [Asticcacaulis taihuensis]|uniref:Parvulin-like PPIase n=1 Tax=Asticcacaulis taihuensis TaxID=260084 RepID=A0A1G4RG43_9CAUL|nr:peptidylprolyl isomerase [Asticcacaulis taihuensis]SCW55601.1 peptidyl-prolyl cis-trans isomerase C [Asticcacaulis taihuensis]